MKLLASDFDGTLYLHDKDKGYILNDDKQEIKSFQEDGNLFGICTGRGVSGVVTFSEDIKFDFYICNTGALILNRNFEVIKQDNIDKSLIKEIIDFFDYEIYCSIVYDNQMYVINPQEKQPDRKIVVNSIDEIPGVQVSSFSMHFKDDEKTTKKHLDIILENFGNRIEAFQNIDNIDMVAKGCSKGNGIKIIQEYFDLNDNDINVIGDSYNDIPMFKSCNNAYTFNHSPKDVQQYAKYCVDTIQECIINIKNDQ